jgi:hypothetical protein
VPHQSARWYAQINGAIYVHLSSAHECSASKWLEALVYCKYFLGPADFWTAIEKVIQHLSQEYTQESTSPPLPFQMSVNKIRNHLRAAFKEQNSIKWTDKHLQGSSVPQVAAICQSACPLETAENSSQQCGTTHSLRIWQFRNDEFHVDTNAQVKCYKLEELERGGTPQVPTHRTQTQTITTPLPTETFRFARYGQRPSIR